MTRTRLSPALALLLLLPVALPIYCAEPNAASLANLDFEQGEPGLGNEPARPLTARGLENLVAFARLFGYVRYFHPSDQAAAADWEALALAGVQAVEGADGPAALARALEGLFRPVAPTVRVFPTGSRPAPPPELAPPAAGEPAVVAWSHLGVAASKAPSIYKSTRVATDQPAPDGGSVMQVLEAGALQGKRVRLRAAGWAEGDARLVLESYVMESEEPVAVAEAPVPSGGWQTVEVEGTVDAKAVALGVAVRLAGGSVHLDDVALEVIGGPAGPQLQNPGFEEVSAGDRPDGWSGRQERWSGFRAVATEERARSGRRSLLLSHKPLSAADLPRPSEPFAADLGGGVSALVPLALYKEAGATLPRVPADLRPPAAGKPEGFLPSGNDRTTRLADVVLAWNVFQHFYPYFDVAGTDWPAELPRALAAAATDADEAAFLATLRRLVAALHDGHGNVGHPAATRTHRLPLLWDWVEGKLVVTRVAAEGAGGLGPGDIVVAVNGRSAAAALAAEEELISGATPQWQRYRALFNLASGPQGEEVELEVERRGGGTARLRLARSLPGYGEGSLEEARPDKIAEVRPGIFYVDVDRISDQDFAGALDRLAQAKGVVFDLRGYPGNLSTVVLQHLTGAPVTSARWHVPIVTRPDRQGMDFDFANWTVQPAAPRFRGKVAFLTDGRAISYAETYLGIVEHYKLAEIVGGPTAGTNGNVNPFTLPGGYRLFWTGMKVLKHDGSRHHGVGIQPTVPATRTLRGVAEGRDEVLEKGIEVVSR